MSTKPSVPANNYHFETWRLFHPAYLCCYCIPVTAHYFQVLFVIKKAKNASGFFLIFFYTGISDVIYCCAMLSSEFCHYTQLFPAFIFTTFVIISYYGVFFNHLSSILLSFNRLCATYVWYNYFFNHSSIKKYFIVIAITSFILTLPGGIVMSIYLYMDFSTSYQYSRTGLLSFTLHRIIIISLTISDTVIGILTSFGTIYRLKKYTFNYDRSLLFVTILHIFPNILVSFFNLDMMFKFSESPKQSNELSRVFLLLLVSFNSLTIVATHHKIRHEYFRMLKFWKEREVSRTTSIVKKSAAPTRLGRITVF